MKKLVRTFTGILILIIVLSSCSFHFVTFSSKKIEKLDKIALISTYLKINRPYSGLAVKVMEPKIKAISNELSVLLQDYANLYRDSLGEMILKNCSCEVLYGEKLQTTPGFAKLKGEFDVKTALADTSGIFSSIFISSNDINPFYEVTPRSMLDTVSVISVKKIIPTICTNLNVNYIAVSYNYLEPQQGDAISKGDRYLTTFIILYDKVGDPIAYGSKSSMPVKLNAAKIEEYPKILKTFSELAKPLIIEISNKYLNK